MMGIVLFAMSAYACAVTLDKAFSGKSLKKWSKYRWYYLVTYSTWSLGFLLLGISCYWDQVAKPAHFISGISWLLMIFVPCGLEIFNKNLHFKIIRGLFFIFIVFFALANYLILQ